MNTPQTRQAAPPGDDIAAEALLHLRPQLTLAGKHPMCPAALRVAFPLLDAVLTGQARQLGDLRAELMNVRRELSNLKRGG